MKIIILILLLSTINFAQSSMLLLMEDSGYKNAETKVYLASLTTPISKTYAATLDSFITKVKDSLSITSLSSKFDVMYDLGGETSEQSLKNLVKRSHDATAVNSPTWTQWQGFTGNGTSSYLNTDYNPSTQAVNLTLNSSTLGMYSRTNNLSDVGVLIGGLNTSVLEIILTNSSRYYLRHNFGGGSDYEAAYTLPSSLGFFVSTRTGTSTMYGYRNGSLVTSFTKSAVAIPNVILTICARGGGTVSAFSTRQYAFAFVSAGLTATEVSKLTNCVEWLMDSKGKGVIP